MQNSVAASAYCKQDSNKARVERMVTNMLTFERQLQDYRLTTVDVTYYLPDYPDLLQTFIWQCLDLPPVFPVVARFLSFWETRLDGRLHSVRIGHGATLKDGAWRHLGSGDIVH